MIEINEKDIKEIKKYIDGIFEELEFLEVNKRGSAVIDGSSILYIKNNLHGIESLVIRTTKDFDGLL